MRLTPNGKLAILCGLVAIPTAIVAWSKIRAPSAQEEGDAALRDYGQAQAARLQQKQIAANNAAFNAAAAAKVRAAALASLFADGRPGALGPLFDGLPAGAWATNPATGARVDALRTRTGATVEIRPDEITVTLPATSGTHTDALRDAALAAWQPGDRDRWLDAADHVRASVTTSFDGSSVRWERTLDVAELFPAAPTTRSTLYPLPGDDDAAPPALGTSLTANAGGYAYTLPAIGWSKGEVRVDVTLAGHTVTAIHLRIPAATDDEVAPIIDALRGRYTARATQHGPIGFLGAWHDRTTAVVATFDSDAVVVDLTRAR